MTVPVPAERVASSWETGMDRLPALVQMRCRNCGDPLLSAADAERECEYGGPCVFIRFEGEP